MPRLLTVGIAMGAVLEHADDAGFDSAAATRRRTGRVVVNVDGFRNDVGDALFALFRDENGFPRDPLRAERRVVTAIQGGRTQAVLDDVTPGTFAISVLHDEDRSRTLSTGFLGMPQEGIGFSQNAHGMFGPPKFEDAALTLSAASTLTVSIHMQYF